MITNKQIERINELYRKQKSIGLNEEEKKEQETLRRLYVDSVKENLRAQLGDPKESGKSKDNSCGCGHDHGHNNHNCCTGEHRDHDSYSKEHQDHDCCTGEHKEHDCCSKEHGDHNCCTGEHKEHDCCNKEHKDHDCCTGEHNEHSTEDGHGKKDFGIKENYKCDSEDGEHKI